MDTLHDKTDRWSVEDASELYEIPRWSQGYFSIAESGHLLVHPDRRPQRAIDLKALVDQLQLRGLELPVLIRFNDILRDRLQVLHDAFQTAIDEQQYRGQYTCVYPIKVNQQRQVVEQIVNHGSPLQYGLEAGSKPELLAVVALTGPETPIICNGFKDAGFMEMALLAQKMGRKVIPVVEKFTELDLIFKYAREIGVRPCIGMRIKLAAKGSGRWQSSGGFRSKFGLTVVEVLRALERLRSQSMGDCFQLLHFHLGSQVTNIRHIKTALTEAARIYVDLSRRGAGLKYLDVGGGLGVDYDGSQTNFESSVNYSLQEYANDVIYHVARVCDDADTPHPTIITESGRAIAAYHSVLVCNVLGVAGQGNAAPLEPVSEDAAPPLQLLAETFEELAIRNIRESYHDAVQAMDTAMNLFSLGHMSLEHRCQAEEFYFAICRKVRELAAQLDYVPEELQGLDFMLSDTYFCNFSVFQSLPDSWAIKQLFPVMPIHRLNECPENHGVLGDITCDSDGKIDRFVNRRDIRRTLRLHAYDSAPYFLGCFLVGAYQEILGDLHNLFGDTHAVHVTLNEADDVVLETVIKGETVAEVLEYVHFNRDDLIHRLQSAVEASVQHGLLDHSEAGRFLQFYENSLNGYTYLKADD